MAATRGPLGLWLNLKFILTNSEDGPNMSVKLHITGRFERF